METLALGTVIGLVMGLTGAGGGILAVPALVLGLHWSVMQAGPVALIAMAIAAAVGAIDGLRRGLVRYRAAAFMAVLGLLMAPVGLMTAAHVPEKALLLAFAATMTVVAIKMLVDARRPHESPHAICHLDPATGRLRWNVGTAAVLGAIGATAGFLSGLLGVGGGFVIVPALRRFTDITMQGVVATSLALIALVSTGTVVMAAAHGRPLPLAVAAPFAAGAALGMVAGRRLARKLSASLLQRIFAVVTGIVGMVLAARALG